MMRTMLLLLLFAGLTAPPKRPIPPGTENHADFFENRGTNGKSCWFDTATVQSKDFIEVSSQYMGYCHSTGSTHTDKTFGLAVVQFPDNDPTHWTIAIIDTNKI